MGSRSRTLEGISIFTTLRVVADGEIRFWDDHLRRLEEGAARFGLRRAGPAALRTAIERAADGIADARVRVRLRCDAPFEVEARPYVPPVEPWILEPVAVSPDEDTVRFKTSRREVYEEATRRTAAGRFALLTDPAGHYLECAIANVFFARGSRLLTPPAAAPILPGIARKRLIEAAPRAGFAVVESECTAESSTAAEACFVTNALFGVHPVAEIVGLRAFPDRGLARRLNLALAT
jgi:branched-subunit amino acid aminotransferase/4-amino-4-deoxychorismate lyase